MQITINPSKSEVVILLNEKELQDKCRRGIEGPTQTEPSGLVTTSHMLNIKAHNSKPMLFKSDFACKEIVNFKDTDLKSDQRGQIAFLTGYLGGNEATTMKELEDVYVKNGHIESRPAGPALGGGYE